jgi:predicted MFS family arabinose efflux permease
MSTLTSNRFTRRIGPLTTTIAVNIVTFAVLFLASILAEQQLALGPDFLLIVWGLTILVVLPYVNVRVYTRTAASQGHKSTREG